MKQEPLFGAPVVDMTKPVATVNLTVTHPVERKRLSAQGQRILARLQSGTATNFELSGIGLNYRARISELRQAGYPVRVKDRNFTTGVTVYILETP
jgi:hypothetical protein